MPRLTIVVEVQNVDPRYMDPHDTAGLVIDHDTGPVPVLVSAQWGDMLPEEDTPDGP